MTNEEAIEILEERWRYSKTYKYTDAEIREAFDMAIKALEQEPKTGHWIRMKAFEKWECSECHTIFRFTFKEHDYCPNCGAKMVESQESEE